jgi:hypothetical protein
MTASLSAPFRRVRKIVISNYKFPLVSCFCLSVLVLFYVLFVLCRFCVLFVCKCVLYNCHRVATQLQLTNISYTQRQARKLILSPSPTAKTRLLSFNRTQSRVVTGLFTAHNTPRRHFYVVGLITPWLGGVGQRKEPQPTFCVSVKICLHSHVHIWAPFLGPRGYWESKSGGNLELW